MADLDIDNAASFLIDQPLAEGLASRAAGVTPERTYTYGELAALSDGAACGLRRLGVEPEQRVALLLHDGIGFAATFLGALQLGAGAVPLNTRPAPPPRPRRGRARRGLGGAGAGRPGGPRPRRARRPRRHGLLALHVGDDGD